VGNRPIPLPIIASWIILIIVIPGEIRKQWMVKCLLPSHPLVLLDLQGGPYPLPAPLGDRRIKGYLPVHDVINELDLVVGWPGRVPVQQLVVDQANRPQIRLVRVVRPVEDLRRHVQRCANYRVHYCVLPVLQVLGETEVADFAAPVLEQDVSWLEVSVRDAQAVQIPEAIGDVLEQPDSLLFGDLLPPPQKAHKVAFFAKLSDDIHVIGGLVDIEELDNIPVFDFLHYLYFGLDVLEVVVIGENLLIDDLDGHRLIICYAPAQVHLGVRALPQRPFKLYYVLLDLLLTLV
jgi:hypothetical protein